MMIEDKLDAIFRMQKLFADQIQDTGRFPETTAERIDKLSQAIIHEGVELQRLTNWKWWKQPKPLNYELACEELIDIFHFVIHAALVLHMTPERFLEEYHKKMETNKQRQKDGY